MTDLRLGQGPARLTVRLDRDDPTTLAATLTSGAWTEPVSLQFRGRASDALSYPGTVAGDTVTWELSAEQVNTILAAIGDYPRARITAGGDIIAAGIVAHGDGWDADTTAPQTILPGAPGGDGYDDTAVKAELSTLTAQVTGTAPNWGGPQLPFGPGEETSAADLLSNTRQLAISAVTAAGEAAGAAPLTGDGDPTTLNTEGSLGQQFINLSATAGQPFVYRRGPNGWYVTETLAAAAEL